MARLQKVIAENSDYSRRKAEELIKQGVVTVNGKVVTEMGIQVEDGDEVIVNDSILYFHEKVYYLINKPFAVISSRKDNFDRPVVTDLIHERTKIYPVGRLDYNTSGLLILTNDGELANGLMHPRYKIPKTYVAKVKGDYTKEDLNKLSRGVIIDGKKTLPAKVKSINYNPKKKTGTVEITIFEGRNLQVRKMFLAIGAQVQKLKRTKYAFFDLNVEMLAEGNYRELKPKEVRQLYNLFETNEKNSNN
ncbi:MAG: pseudouridine synthase [Mycoplasmatales bacterium]